MRTSETRLVRRAKLGSAAAVAELFERHWPGIWRAAYAVTGRRDSANDAAQDAFVRAIAALEAFDESRPLAPWLRRIAVNCAIDAVRLAKRSAELDEDAFLVEDEHLDHDPRLLEAVARLPLERRVVVVLHYWLGLPLAEISEVLELPAGTVASRLGRALDQLRHELEADHVR